MAKKVEYPRCLEHQAAVLAEAMLVGSRGESRSGKVFQGLRGEYPKWMIWELWEHRDWRKLQGRLLRGGDAEVPRISKGLQGGTGAIGVAHGGPAGGQPSRSSHLMLCGCQMGQEQP